jgi:hypothetical protein
MPSEALIQYKEKGFWIPEAFIEVLSQYICEAYEQIGLDEFPENLKEIYNECDSNRSGASIGMVNILLDEYIVNESEKNLLFSVFEQTKILLQLKGTELSIADLNSFEDHKVDDYFKSEWHFPIKTQSLIATLNIMEQMLNETWESSNYGVYYSGFPNPAGREEI